MPRFHIVAALTLLLPIISPHLKADEPINIGSRLELFVDNYLIDSHSDNAQLRLHQPTIREVVIVHNEPWEGNASGYHTMFQDGGIYRMYYRGHAYAADERGLRGLHREVTCYAESNDGIHWTKPKLGLFEFGGSTENNIIWQGVGSHNFAPFFDTNPHSKPDEKYKAVGGTSKGLHAYKSADGIHWSRIQDEPIFTKGAFDSQNVAFWDSARNRYATYFRFFTKGKFKGLRAIGMITSTDLKNWSSPVPLRYPHSPEQQMYTNQVIPYYRAPHMLMGFPTRYVARDLTPHVQKLDPVPLRTRLTKALKRVGSDLTDGMFMTSRDGVTFKRWDEAFLRPGPQTEGRWIYGDNYQSWGLIETKSNIVNSPNEISFYSSEGSWRDGEARERRYTIRLDGFVSMQAPLSGGEVVTKPLIFHGKQLAINYSTSAAGSIRVEIQDAKGDPLPGFTLTDSPEHYGDAIEQTIRWKSGNDVSSLAGKPVRLRFVFKDADLYSLRFR